MPFDSPDVNLGDLLKDIHGGKIQLPDFQREWKWDTDRIQSLLASISQEYPVGVVMTLEVGGSDVNFAPRPFSGAPDPPEHGPEQLVLDGQQRLTSLYQALYSGSVVATTDARGKRLQRWYYLDMAMALDPNSDREESIVAVPADRKVTTNFGKDVVLDLTTTEKECAAEMFPLGRLFDVPSLFAWNHAYVSQEEDSAVDRANRWNKFYANVLQTITSYTVPVIVLKKQTPKEAVCTVFEKVNTGGVVLNVFELLTATFAAGNYRLNDDWKKRCALFAEKPVLRSLQSTDFLQSVCLLTTLTRKKAFLDAGGDPGQAPGVSCRRREILRLTLDDYLAWADKVEEAFLALVEFFHEERIFRADDLPYRTQLVPLAALWVALGPDAALYANKEKLRRWFWSGVLGELYGGATETRFARDLEDGLDWILGGGSEPGTVSDANFAPARLLTLRTRNSAAYKGVYALLMKGGCRDWMLDQDVNFASFYDQHLDIHHIFPKDWCGKNNVERDRQESIINKTAIAAVTNRTIGGKAPSTYLPAIEKKAGISDDKLDALLADHAIDPTLLRHDDFNGFFAARRAALLDMIGAAMGKPVTLEADAFEQPSDYEDEPPDLEDADSLTASDLA